jgi:BirA family biotin operon repressor/biotin-[acetyl-CoA-carboxylase] ligase
VPNLGIGTRFDRVRWVRETGSTNDDLLAAARAGEPEGAVLVADHQTAGRGRLDRRFEAAPGSALLCSILLRPGSALAAPWWATASVAVAAAAAVDTVSGVTVAIKWPNDLAVVVRGDERKLGGILTQAITDGDDGAALVVGLGLNVNPDPDELYLINPQATSLAAELSGRSPVPSREALLGALLSELEHLYGGLLAGSHDEVAARYRERSCTLGGRVRVHVGVAGAAEVVGRAEDLAADGGLVLRLDDGTRRCVEAGDVTRLRGDKR